MTASAGKRRRATLADVATLAGVSPTTASFVLNDKAAGIAQTTSERVWVAARQLAYSPNPSAKALRTRRTEFVGFLTDAVATTPYAGEIIRGAQDAAWAHGQVLLVVNTGGSVEVERAAVDMMLSRQVEGVLLASMHTQAITLPVGLHAGSTVLINCFLDTDEANSPATVLPDDQRGGHEATQTLLTAGHRRIAYINGDASTHAWRQRLDGYRRAHAEAGVAVDEDLIREGNWHPDGGFDLTHQLFTEANPPTALLCANDRTAHGAYDALRERGLSIPADVSVMGYDDQEMSQFLRPALSTIALPHYELGRRGCELLLAHRAPPGSRELVSCPPRIRQSTAAAPQ